MALRYPHLFQPIRLGRQLFLNRIFSAPTGYRNMTYDSIYPEEALQYYRRKAMGGCASVSTGELIVDTAWGRGSPNQICIDNPASRIPLGKLAFAISRYGAVPTAELTHAGMYANRTLSIFGGEAQGEAYGPVETELNGRLIREMPESMIEETIGKLAASLRAQGKKVVIGAADTFRAAAVDQLVIWAERAGVDIVRQEMGSDPASVAFDTVKAAVARGADVVLIDTAGRLHNRIDLMNELTKIRNVMRKVIPDAPHDVMLVLDSTTGQNAFQQAKEFSRATDVTSLAVTKLDGSAKGGVVIGIVDQFRIPIKFIGIGEGIDDLKVFDKREFVRSLFSREDIKK